jgi:hypothetical protein
VRRIILAALAAFVVLSTGAQAAPAPSPGCPTVIVASAGDPPVKHVRTHTQAEYRAYASKVFQRQRVSWRAIRKIVRMERCQHSPKARSNTERLRKRLTRERRARQAAERYTPFGGWAIPAYIVMCESHGSWTAYNSASGARGPYQFVGWPVPWPVRTAADRAAHHRMAAKLWAGGAGAGHWECA